jgi:hypothetical protein
MLIRKIYICGAVTGLPEDETKSKFAAAADYWAEHGCNPVNPMQVVNDPHAKWEYAMHKCLHALLDCQAIYILPDWEDSRGARLEIRVAYALGLDLIPMELKQEKAIAKYLSMEECICVTAAAKYRCRHHHPGHDKCDLEINQTYANGSVPKMECPPPPPTKNTYMATQKGLQPELCNDYRDVLLGEKAFKQTWADWATKLEADARDHNGFPHIIETHYGNPDTYTPAWFEIVFEKLCMLLLVLVCLPWLIWQFVKKPDQAVKLPFID